MRVAVFCLLMLAVTIKADDAFVGRWFATMYDPSSCSPAGLVNIALDNGKYTLKGKWQSSERCKEVGVSGDIALADGAVTGTALIFKFKSTKDTDVVFTLAPGKDGQMGVAIVFAGDATKPAVNGMIKASDDDLKKLRDVKGTYSFSIGKVGNADTCCIPDSLEITEPDTDAFAVKGKWAQSKACKDIKANDLDISKAISIDSPMGFVFLQSTGNNIPMTAVIANDPTGTLKGLQFANPLTPLCQVDVSKSGGSKAWIWIIVVILIIAVVGVAGFCLYKRKQQSASQPAYLRA